MILCEWSTFRHHTSYHMIRMFIANNFMMNSTIVQTYSGFTVESRSFLGQIGLFWDRSIGRNSQLHFIIPLAGGYRIPGP